MRSSFKNFPFFLAVVMYFFVFKELVNTLGIDSEFATTLIEGVLTFGLGYFTCWATRKKQ